MNDSSASETPDGASNHEYDIRQPSSGSSILEVL